MGRPIRPDMLRAEGAPNAEKGVKSWSGRVAAPHRRWELGLVGRLVAEPALRWAMPGHRGPRSDAKDGTEARLPAPSEMYPDLRRALGGGGAEVSTRGSGPCSAPSLGLCCIFAESLHRNVGLG